MESALGKFGITLKQVGHGRGGGIRYSTGSKGGREGDYSSLVFFKNPNDTWVVIDNKQRNGKLSYDALGALTELFGMRFADAVQLLSSGGIGFMAQGSASFKETGASEKPLSYLPEKIFRLPEKAPSAKHAAAYLTKARGIRGELVSELMHRGVIYEAIRKSPDGKEMPMVVFPSFDEKRNAVGAECCSAYSSVRFKHIVGGSDPRFGWRFSMGNPPEGAKKLFFCESAIDAMSLFCLTALPAYTFLSLV